MSNFDIIKKKIKLIIFDQYGTIVDMQKGLTEAVIPFLKNKKWEGDPNRFVTWWRRTHFENSMIDALSKNNHTNYRTIGQNAVSYVMDRCGINYTKKEVEWLIKQIEVLKPFPDVILSLNKLREKNITCELYPSNVKIKKQLDYANQKGIDYVVIIGDEEVKSNIFKLKNMKSGSQSSIDISNLLSEIESLN